MHESLNNLTERELLLLMNHRLQKVEDFITKFDALEVKVQELETRMKIWATVISLVGSLAGSSVLSALSHI